MDNKYIWLILLFVLLSACQSFNLTDIEVEDVEIEIQEIDGCVDIYQLILKSEELIKAYDEDLEYQYVVYRYQCGNAPSQGDLVSVGFIRKRILSNKYFTGYVDVQLKDQTADIYFFENEYLVSDKREIPSNIEFARLLERVESKLENLELEGENCSIELFQSSTGVWDVYCFDPLNTCVFDEFSIED